MPKYVSSEIFKEFNKKKVKINKTKILIMGMTFKENCPDIRNSKVLDLYDYLANTKAKIFSYDPTINFDDKFKKKYNIINNPKKNFYDCVVVAVRHNIFLKKKQLIEKYLKKDGFIFDLKYILKNRRNHKRL